MLEWKNVSGGSMDGAASLMRASQQSLQGAFESLERFAQGQEQRLAQERQREQADITTNAMQQLLEADADSLDSLNFDHIEDSEARMRLLEARDQRAGELQHRELVQLTRDNAIRGEQDAGLYANAREQTVIPIQEAIHARNYAEAETLIAQVDSGNDRVTAQLRSDYMNKLNSARELDSSKEERDLRLTEARVRLQAAEQAQADDERFKNYQRAIAEFGGGYRAAVRANQQSQISLGVDMGIMDSTGAFLEGVSDEQLEAYRDQLFEMDGNTELDAMLSQYMEMHDYFENLGDPEMRDSLIQNLQGVTDANRKMPENIQREQQEQRQALTASRDAALEQIAENDEYLRSRNTFYDALRDTRRTSERQEELESIFAGDEYRRARAEFANWIESGVEITQDNENIEIRVTPELIRMFMDELPDNRDTIRFRNNSQHQNYGKREFESWVRERALRTRGGLREATEGYNQFREGTRQVEQNFQQGLLELERGFINRMGVAGGTTGRNLLSETNAFLLQRQASANEDIRVQLNSDNLTERRNAERMLEDAAHIQQRINHMRPEEVERLEAYLNANPQLVEDGQLQMNPEMFTGLMMDLSARSTPTEARSQLSTVREAQEVRSELQQLEREKLHLVPHSPEWREVANRHWELRRIQFANRQEWDKIGDLDAAEQRLLRDLEFWERQ